MSTLLVCCGTRQDQVSLRRRVERDLRHSAGLGSIDSIVNIASSSPRASVTASASASASSFKSTSTPVSVPGPAHNSASYRPFTWHHESSLSSASHTIASPPIAQRLTASYITSIDGVRSRSAQTSHKVRGLSLGLASRRTWLVSLGDIESGQAAGHRTRRHRRASCHSHSEYPSPICPSLEIQRGDIDQVVCPISIRCVDGSVPRSGLDPETM